MGILVLWIACPVWFPWVFRPLAAAWGVHYEQYHRDGYARFALTRVRLDQASAHVDADRVEAVLPTVWLWRVQAGRPSGTRPFLLVDRWRFIPSSAPARGTSTDGEIRALEKALALLGRWLPSAVLSNGTARIGGKAVAIPVIHWSAGSLQAFINLPPPGGLLSVSADLGAGPPYRVAVSAPALRLDSIVRVSHDASGTRLESVGSWWSNRVEARAHFPRSGHLPDTASLEAREFRVPASQFSLARYQAVSGSVTASWNQGTFEVEFNAAAQPEPKQASLPPLRVELRAHGSTNAATVEMARLSSPWLQASISQPLVIDFKGQRLREPVDLSVAADLDRQSWLPLRGSLEGTASLEPAAGRFPRARFELTGSEVGTTNLRARIAHLAGRFDWPWLTITEANARTAEGSAVSISGRLDLDKRVVADGQFQFEGPLAKRWLPPGYWYRGLSARGEFSGPLDQLVHHGQLTAAQVVSPYLQPVDLHLQWQGQERTLESFRLEVAATKTTLQAEGSGSVSQAGADVQFSRLTLSHDHQAALELTRPVSVVVGPGTTNSAWRLETTPLTWAGTAGEVDGQARLEWPRQAAVRLLLRGVSSSLLADLIKAKLPAVGIRKLDAVAGWTNGPITFSVASSLAGSRAELEAQWPGLRAAEEQRAHSNGRRAPPAEMAAGAPAPEPDSSPAPNPPVAKAKAFPTASILTASLEASGGPDGIAISNLVVASGASNLISVRGFLPVFVEPANRQQVIRVDSTKPLQVTAATRPDAFFWGELGEWSGLALTAPELKIELGGTWQAPSGDVWLRVQRVGFPREPARVPPLENVELALHVDRRWAQLTQGQLAFQGQRISVTGQIPLGPEFWRDLRDGRVPDWKKATARVRIQNASLAAFEPLLPSVLAPDGELDVDLSLLPDARFSGEMRLQNARTHPLGDLGAIRHIDINLRFADRTVKLENASADIGAAAIRLSGQADLRGTEWLKGTLPPFALTLSGTNMPLAREPEAVIRSDLQLAIIKTNGAPPLITGLARLHDSFFLADLSSLIPGEVAAPARRPPYFSIEDPWVADWRLAVGVEGVRFLKVRTPLFNGEISASLKLQGTLKDPLALGDLRVDSGSVVFPFGSLEVQQGLVTLTSQNPYHPQLSVAAASKQFGYDIRLEVTGPVDAPVIQFSSTPPLSSEQILLMITAGQVPQGALTLTPQQKAQTMALFFGRDLLAKLGLGDQAQARLTVRSGQEISDQGRPTYHVEYRLSKHWSLVGEYDRFGDFNAGFKWRILSR